MQTTGTCNYDSILAATDSNIINTSQYYRLGHELPSNLVGMTGRDYAASADSWLLLFVFLSLWALAAIFHEKHLAMAFHFRQFFSGKRQFAVDGVNTKSFWACSVLLVFMLFLFVSLVFFDHLSSRHCFSDIQGIPYWGIPAMASLLFLFFFLKMILCSTVNWVFFPTENNARWRSGYIFVTSLFAFPAFLLMLLDLFSAVSPDRLLQAYAILLAIYETLLIFKLFINFKLKKRALFFIFLYLCSSELVPALILLKILQWATNSFIEENALY